MKKCHNCKREKPLSEFNKNKTRKDGYGSSCRECMNAYNRKNYLKYMDTIRTHNQKRKKENIKWLHEYKSTLKCEKCGYNKHQIALDFHHINPKLKDDAIYRIASGGHSKDRILKEIAKCKVLCAICHRVEHQQIRTSGSTDKAVNS